MDEKNVYIIENGNLIDMTVVPSGEKRKTICIIPDEVKSIRGKGIVPYDVDKFQITDKVRKINLTAFSITAHIHNFIVTDYKTGKVIFKKRFKVDSKMGYNANLTQDPEFRDFIKRYPKILTEE